MDLTVTVFYAVSMGVVLIVVACLATLMPSVHTSWVVRMDASIAWITALSTLVLVPVDVSGAFHTGGHKRQDHILSILWILFFWNGLFMQVTLLPLHQGFVEAGGLTAWDKLRSSLMRNMILFMALLTAVCTFLLVTSVTGLRLDWHLLLSLGAAFGNAVGLAVGIFLMAYGLFEIPKRLWSLGNVHARHRTLFYRAGVHHANAASARRDLIAASRVAADANRLFRRSDSLKSHVEAIACMPSRAAPPFDPLDPEEQEPGDDGAEIDYDFASRKQLGRLKRRVRSAMEAWERCAAIYLQTAREFVELEDILHNMDREWMRFQSAAPSARPVSHTWAARAWGHLLWWWRCRIKLLLYRAAAVVTGLLSVAVVLAEATISPRLPNLSVFSWAMRACSSNVLALQLICMLSLAYPICCTYFTLFRLGQTQFFLLVPRHTSPHSLLTHATLMCRFAAPLAFNFMIAMALPYTPDSKDIDLNSTIFYHEIGRGMISLPVIGYELTTYLPPLMGVIVVLLLLNIPNQLALCLLPDRKIRVIASDQWDDGDCPGPSREGQALLSVELENFKRMGKLGLGCGTLVHSRHFETGARCRPSLREPLLPNGLEALGASAGKTPRTPAAHQQRPQAVCGGAPPAAAEAPLAEGSGTNRMRQLHSFGHPPDRCGSSGGARQGAEQEGMRRSRSLSKEVCRSDVPGADAGAPCGAAGAPPPPPPLMQSGRTPPAGGIPLTEGAGPPALPWRAQDAAPPTEGRGAGGACSASSPGPLGDLVSMIYAKNRSNKDLTPVIPLDDR